MLLLFWQSFRHSWLGMSGALIILTIILVALAAPWLAPYDPNAVDLTKVLLSPSPENWLGTDDLGRDVLSRMIHGASISLLVGVVAVGISLIIGTLIGAISGYAGGWSDTALMRFVDIMLCFPSFFLILAVIAFLQPSIYNIMAVIGLTSWMGVARLVRAEFLRNKELGYVLSARVSGCSPARIIFRHLLPASYPSIIVAATLGIAGAILTESALSFLGIGVQPPTPSWGNMLAAGKENIDFAWWLSLFPGLAIFIAVMGFNLLGEGLRDILSYEER